MSDFNPGWPLAPGMAGQPAYQSPEINFGASQTQSMNQGFNSLVPSHTTTQQNQWNLGNHLPPNNPSLNNFGSPKLFDPTGFSNATNLGQQNQFTGATGNNQSGVSLFPQSANHGASAGVRSPQANRQAPGLSFQVPGASQTEPHATWNPQSNLSQPLSATGIRTSPTGNQATQARHPIPAPSPDDLDLGHDEGNVRWVPHSTSSRSFLNSVPVCPTGLPS
jgi:hypothetical protein